MKSIFYVGAALMLGASVYGFIDYKKTRSKNEFRELYGPKESSEPATVKMADPPVKTKAIPALKDEPKKDEIAIKKEITATDREELIPSTKKTSAITKKYKHGKKKRVNHKLFSRAPLREPVEQTPAKVAER